MGDEWTIERHLDGANPDVRALYERLVEIVEQCGPFTSSAAKTAITFKGTHRGFAGAKLRKQYLGGYFDLTRQIEDQRITRVTPYTKRLFVHAWRIDRLEQFDDDFEQWIAEAYGVGDGAHLAE